MAEITLTVTRTLKFKIKTENAGDLLAPTVAAWDKALSFYLGFFLAHKEVFTEKKTDSRTGKERPLTAMDLLTWAEYNTVPTAAHHSTMEGWNFSAVCPQAPTILRRAVINSATGAVRSYVSALSKWEKTNPEKRGREPQPPQPGQNMVFYTGLYQMRLEEFRDGNAQLKVFNGGKWCFKDFAVSGPPYALDLLDQSQAERERIAEERKTQNRRLLETGCKERTDGEKEALRPTIGVWVAQSPTLFHKEDGFWLHMPFEKRVRIPGKAEERRLAEPALKVGTVDLNAASAAAVAWEGEKTLEAKTVWHTEENGKREKALQKVARKQKASGKPVKGESSNRDLWRYVRNLDDSVAWQVASSLVVWAVSLGLQVLVFEYLRSYCPEKGGSYSKRVNRKRSYCLRGGIGSGWITSGTWRSAKEYSPSNGILPGPVKLVRIAAIWGNGFLLKPEEATPADCDADTVAGQAMQA